MPRTPMSDTPLSPVSEYYKVLNKRIMEEKTVEEKIQEKVLQASLPKHESFEPFIFNDKIDNPKGWDESIAFAQENYCSLNHDLDNSRPIMRQKAISAWSYQAGYSAGVQSLQSTLDRYETALREICNPKYSRYDCYDIADEALKSLNEPSDEK